MQTEIYKDITGYEWLYQVSDMGNVYSLVSSRVLKPNLVLGYHQVGLSKNWVVKYYYVHRLVALTFLPNPEAKREVNHIDGVKTNNSLSNLEWCTRSENLVHSRDVLGNTLQGKFLGNSIAAVGVIQYDLDWNEIERFTSIRGASLATGVDEGNIPNACRGKRKSAGGYRWSYS